MLIEIKNEIDFLENILEECTEIIEQAPKGKLRCAINKGHYQYYMGKTYLGQDKKAYIKQLAQKEYCEKLKTQIEKYLQKLKEIEIFYRDENLEEQYRRLHPGRKQLVEPLIKPVEEIIKEFEKIEYVGKGFPEEDETAYYTIKGERVRSKSEKIIADELCRYQIPYKYELPVELRHKNRILQFYPDFTALNKRTGKRWIIEHLGMMDKNSYFENAMQKLDIYEKNEILLGKDLILLHETSTCPLNTNVLRQYIETYLC